MIKSRLIEDLNVYDRRLYKWLLIFFKGASLTIRDGCRSFLTAGIDESENYPVKPSHFIPCSSWDEQEGGEYWVDKSNGDQYYCDSLNTKRLMCLALAGATPCIHGIGTFLHDANLTAKLMTLSHFWYSDKEKGDYSFKKRSFEFGRDFLRVSFSPMIYAGLEASAIYGLVSPLDGGKLYATLERSFYGDWLLAPCFQPSPRVHLGGGRYRRTRSLVSLVSVIDSKHPFDHVGIDFTYCKCSR